MFKLSTQATSPTGDEEDSIAKVLDWFSRSTDSSDWLNTDNGPEAKKTSNKLVDISVLRNEDPLRKDSGDFISDMKKDNLEMKRSHLQRQSIEAKEFRATDRQTGSKELTETREEVQKDSRERMRLQEVKDNDDESQPPKISHLKSFWEKSNVGPKILISKSITPSDEGQKLVYLSADKDVENKPHTVSDVPSGICSGRGIYDKYASNDREQAPVISQSQKDIADPVHVSNNQPTDCLLMNTLSHRKNNDPLYNTDYLKLLSSPQVSDRTSSDADILCVNRLGQQPRSTLQSRLSPESESVPPVKPNPGPDTISQSRETRLQEELSKTVSVSQLDTYVLTRDPHDSEKIYFSRNSPYMDYKQSGNDMQITSKAQLRRGSVEEVKRRDSEDKSIQLSMSPKRKEDVTNKDRTNSSQSNRQGLPHQETTAERIKQLKSFWEQDRNKPMFYTGKPKALGEGKVTRGANQAKLNKRFTKSEYDLRSIGNDSGSDEEGRNHNFTVLPLNQRIEKSSPSLSTSRTQFNTLREFWDEATSDSKGTLSFDKPKIPKRRESLGAALPFQEFKGGDLEGYRLSSAVEKTRPAAMKSSPQSRSKSPHDRQMGSRSTAMNDSKNNLSTYASESRRSSKDSGREEKSTKPQGSSGKETRPPKNRKDSLSNSSSRGNSLRRATSMFSLTISDEKDQGELKMDVSPVHSQSRKQRQHTEDTETVAPRARAFVPRDYRHYLGMTDKTSVHTSLAPAGKDEGPDGKSGYEFDLSGPVRASTPVSSDDRYNRRGSKSSQRPLWATYSSSDTGQESSVSSTSETWSTARISSNREYSSVSSNN